MRLVNATSMPRQLTIKSIGLPTGGISTSTEYSVQNSGFYFCAGIAVVQNQVGSRVDQPTSSTPIAQGYDVYSPSIVTTLDVRVEP